MEKNFTVKIKTLSTNYIEISNVVDVQLNNDTLALKLKDESFKNIDTNIIREIAIVRIESKNDSSEKIL